MADLELVLQQLHNSEINAGVQTFYDAGRQRRKWPKKQRLQRWPDPEGKAPQKI